MSADGEEPRGFWRSGLGYLTQLGIVLTAVAAIVGGIASFTGDKGSGAASRPGATPTAKLQAVDLAVSGGDPTRCINDPPDPVRLDLTVRNVGDQPAVVKRLGFRVRDTGLLEIPQAGGGLEPSKDYDILFPGKPRVGQLAVYKISQEVRRRANDRFTVRLDEPEPDRQLGVRLYQLDVLLYHDTSTAPVKAGTALVAVPHLPDKGFFRSGNSWAQGDPGDQAPVLTMDENEKTYRRMLALTGERSPDLNRDLVDVPVAGLPRNECLPSGKSPQETAQPPLSNGGQAPDGGA